MVWFYVLSGIILGSIIIIITVKTKTASGDFYEISDKTYKCILILLTVLFAFLLLYKVTSIPTAFNTDEAGSAYDAASIAKYHCDRHLYRFPVYFVNFGIHGQSALYTYLAAISITMFGNNVLTIRLPAIVLAFISALAFAFFMRKEFGNTASIITLVLFCILPFSIMHSRWGLDCYLFFPMMILSIVVFYSAVQNMKTGWWILSGCVFGLTLYSYSVSFMVVPLVLGINLLYLLWIRKITWKEIVKMGIPLFAFACPLMLMIAVNNGYIDEIKTRFFSIPKLNAYSVSELHPENIINSLKFSADNVFYNIFVNDRIVYNVNPNFGTIYYISLPIALYGFILSMRKCIKALSEKSYSLDLLMSALFFSMLIISMIIKKTNINRSSCIFIPVIYYLVLSLLEIYRRKRKAAYAADLLYLGYFLCFINYYFTKFPEDLKYHILFSSVADLRDALTFAQTVKPEGETIYIPDYNQPYIYTLLAMDIDPFTFNQQKVYSSTGLVKMVGEYRFNLDAVIPECVYVFRYPEFIPEDIDNYGFDVKQFGDIFVYYSPIYNRNEMDTNLSKAR